MTAAAFRSLLVSGLLLLTAVSRAASESQNLGLDPAVLAEIPSRLQRFMADHTISGAVTLVARHGQIAHLAALGMSDLAESAPMQTNSIFWIASMTKPITATAVMILQDEGKLSLDDPVEKHLPEFRDQWLLEARTNDSMTLRRPPRPITIRDLLTHTSGIGDVPPPRPNASLAELVAAYSQRPLQFPPGSKWSYSNAGMNTLGRLVEVISGRPFAEFLEERILRPLEMKDTTFWLSDSQQQRLAVAYEPKRGNAGLQPTEIFFLKGALTDHSRTPFPAGGLFSTAEDYFHFAQMLLDGGKWNGRQILSEKAVAEMTKTQTGELETGFTEGMSFGLGLAVVKKPAEVTGMLSPGTFGHGGAYGTQAWVDPVRKLVLILMIQRAQLPNADRSDVRRVFQETAVSALRN